MSLKNEGMIRKLHFKNEHPIIGPLTTNEKEIILIAREWLDKKTPCKLREPYFYTDQNVKGSSSVFLYPPSPIHLHMFDQNDNLLRRFEPYFQTLIIQKWLSDNKPFLKATEDYKKSLGALKANTPIFASLRIFTIKDSFLQFAEHISQLKDLLKTNDKYARDKGGRPISSEKILIQSLKEHKFLINKWPVKFKTLSPKQITYVLVATGIWIPETKGRKDLETVLKDFIEDKVDIVKKHLKRPKSDLIVLKRLFVRDFEGTKP
ncbi:MAG: hypothetical protein KDD46_06520 [Bdellovibrionales bacterium]|nr:hypothetical protein [Bdellovibrionales bacterium]